MIENDVTNEKRRKIIMLLNEFPSLKLYRDYGFFYLEKQFEIQIWVSPTFDTLIQDTNYAVGAYKGSNVHQASSFSQIEHMVKKESKEIFALEESARNYYRKLMVKYECKYYLISSNGCSLPVDRKYEPTDRNMTEGESSIDKVKRWASYGYRWMIRAVKIKIADCGEIINMTVCPNPPKWIFYSHKTIDGVNPQKTCMVYVPSVDYNHYNEIKRTEMKPNDEKYIVFVDSGLGFKTRGLLPRDYTDPIYEEENRRKHFEAIENVLSLLEEYYGIPVVIAAHPHIVYGGYTYGNRKMIVGDTATLVKYSDLCVFRDATASMSYAVMYGKRILLLYDNISKIGVGWNWLIIPMMSALNIKGCNMDKDCERKKPWDCVETIGDNERRAYFDKYIGFGQYTDKTIGEIIEETILE